MITFLHGKLVEMLPTQVTVDVHGVGYEVLIPLSSFDKLPQPGQEIRLLTHLAVREDAQTLYGFMSAAERELFRLLIKEQRQRHRAKNCPEHSEWNQRNGISRGSGKQRREGALANFGRRKKDRRAHGGRIERQSWRCGSMGSVERATGSFA